MVSLLANIGIMFMAVYFYLKSKMGLSNQNNTKIAYFMKCILFEVLLGIVLLSFSTVILGLRYDFRFLMFCFSAKYMDWKITSSSILLLGIIRFVWGSTDIAQINLIVSILLAVTLPLIIHYTQDKLNDLTQLLVLVTYSLITSIAITNHLIADKALVLGISVILFTFGYATTFVMHYFMSDLYSLIVSASTDPLTTLKNVRTFNNNLMEVEREKKPVTLAVVDIDHFKNFNDSFGHDSGDVLLKQMAQVFNELAAPGTAFYRIGGEEFAVIIDNSNPSKAEEFINDLQEIIAHRSFFITTGEPVNITISVGVAHSHTEETLNKTLKRADLALYKAKKGGRNKVIVSFPL
ncbi:GGDEF domain-containing protein [Trichococcus sp. K1Tr]|uniref:GGDEF domain-containing protein n=1 Tax=Trichococcus sp. K1Tr TaxID=3020847 RepID=UPI00232BBFB8|nr:GGDEF domain-containing protein [Trichococcus sp. K1Tr]MDB6354170.1 GGDEF domain-containing protein [Trichococcus sp. K1Tr]